MQARHASVRAESYQKLSRAVPTARFEDGSALLPFRNAK